jgi:Predicted Rossmann fold nucleotide-binding protein involved in DNA uptake
LIEERYRDVLADAHRITGMLKDDGVGFIPFYSPDYPRALREYRLRGSLYRPLVLYVKPPVSLDRRFVAVVGTRMCSKWGRRTARKVGALIASYGYTLVTGLAECIDVGAVEGALERGGLTVGVRPWLKPLNLPRESREILERSEDKVVLTSEHYEKPPVSIKMLYYLRNRIIAGMADLIVVVEARPGGGSMHQIAWAIKQQKPLAIFKHPDASSEYYKAYMEYAKHKHTITLGDLKELKTLLEGIMKGKGS